MSHPFNIKHPIHILATGFYSGLIKPAPGTWGTLAAALIYLLVLSQLSIHFFYGLTLFSAIAGIYICGKCAKDCGTHDHGSIVWDEFAGYWLSLAIVSFFLLGTHIHPIWQALAFLLFRLFDIAKPFPIGFLDRRLSGGLGIMLDDLIAGVFAALSLIAVIKVYGFFVLA